MHRLNPAFFVALMLLAAPLLATGPNDVVEASMLVRGTIDVLPDGSVASYELYKADKVPPAVADLIKRNVAAWKFELNGTRTTTLRESMWLRMVANQTDDRHMTLRLASASFDDQNVPNDST